MYQPMDIVFFFTLKQDLLIKVKGKIEKKSKIFSGEKQA